MTDGEARATRATILDLVAKIFHLPLEEYVEREISRGRTEKLSQADEVVLSIAFYLRSAQRIWRKHKQQNLRERLGELTD